MSWDRPLFLGRRTTAGFVRRGPAVAMGDRPLRRCGKLFCNVALGALFVVSSLADDSTGSASARSEPGSEPGSTTPAGDPLVAGEPSEAAAGSGAAATEASTQGSNAQRTALNLLGQVDTSSGESRRNENVEITLIDNNVLKELNIRMGTTATIVRSFDADKGYFGAEFGGAPAGQIHLPAAKTSRFHGNIYESHNNSVFSARSFFQVGGVRPAPHQRLRIPLGHAAMERRTLHRRWEPAANSRQRQRKCPGSWTRRKNAAGERSPAQGFRVQDSRLLPG